MTVLISRKDIQTILAAQETGSPLSESLQKRLRAALQQDTYDEDTVLERIACEMKRRGLTKAQLARDLDVTSGFVTMMFNGTRRPTKGMLSYFGMERAEIIRRVEKSDV